MKTMLKWGLLFLLLPGLGYGAGWLARSFGFALPAGLAPRSEGDGTEQSAAVTQSGQPASGWDYIRLNNQFVVPVLEDGRVISLIALSLSLEALPGQSDLIFAREPKLRDRFLQVLFDYANTGGFTGFFTDTANMVSLRQALLETAVQVLGEGINDVLITEIARQDSS